MHSSARAAVWMKQDVGCLPVGSLKGDDFESQPLTRRGRKRRSYIPDSGSSAFSAWQQGGEVFSLMSVEKGPEDEENKSGDSSYMQSSM